MSQELQANAPKWRVVLSMMFQPGAVLKKAMSGIPWYFSVSVSGLAFLLFFLQTGLDFYRTGQQGMSFVIRSAAVGLAFGLVVIPLIGVLVFGIAKLFGSDKTLLWAVSAFSLCYSSALVYCAFGIIASSFMQWRTALAFGVSGVLWATGPILSTIREMTGGKAYVGILISTLASAAVLLCWALLGQIG